MKCRLCGCTDQKACKWRGVGPCWWVVEGVPVCSRCWVNAPPIVLVHELWGQDAVAQIEAMLVAPVLAGDDDIDPVSLRKEILG